MKTYTVIFSAPWHVDNSGYTAVVKAASPREAFRLGVLEDYDNFGDNPFDPLTEAELASVTLIAVFEGRVQFLDID